MKKRRGSPPPAIPSASVQEAREEHSQDLSVDRDGHSPFPIVGVGASAGGYEAFRQLVGKLPADSGMAFVLIQHLAPHSESRLSELLSKSTSLPVLEATDGIDIEHDHVYVIPPNADLSIHEGRLHVTPRGEAPGPHLSVDHFFRSLALEQQRRAIGVVLSGTGSDGTLGLGEIKAAGGITFAQDEQSATHSGMPRSARESGCVDFVLTPGEIAKRLVQIATHPYLAPAPKAPEAPEAEDAREEEPDEHFRRILSLVRNEVGVDLSQYRKTTIRRRIMRRMALHAQQTLPEYLERLEKDRNEVVALYHDLLINVTSFFRDPELFESLKREVFPELAKRRSPAQPYRIWVPGCSTGQEAYSLAMALIEFHDTRPIRPAIQIFATDLSDQTTLERARAGVYPDSIAAEMSPERLRRFFKKEDHVYRIEKSLRDMCIFARQNLTADPPFSRLDLISCRNVLIYLGAGLQKRVIPTFHYALGIPGYLVLGTAESIGDHSELFDLVDRTNKIYAKKPAAIRPLIQFRAEDFRHSEGMVWRRNPVAPTSDFQKEVDRILLARYAPPAVLVNPGFDIVQFRGRTSAYLEAPPGEPTTNVLKMAREGLFLELRNALTEAKKSGQVIRRDHVVVAVEEGSREIALEILPVRGSAEESASFLILFHDPRAQAAPVADKPVEPAPSEDEPATAAAARRESERLRQELLATKDYLQSLAEQQDASNEELRSANEEILSSNEELQSTNEELETAKEELQSTNEELTTVNEQLQQRNVELSLVNDDLTNLLSSTNIPLVMAGSDLRIRRFTPPATRILSLLPTDIGRPLGDIRAIAELADFDTLIADVVERVQTVEHEVRDREGRWYTLRVAPYRTRDNKIEGAVILLVDIDQIRRGQEELQAQAATLRQQAALIALSHDAVIVRDAQNRVVFWNHGAEEMYGFSAEMARGKVLNELLRTEADVWAEVLDTLHKSGSWEGELRQKRSDGAEMVVYSRETLVTDEAGNATALSIKRDITADKRMLHALKEADRRKDMFLATLAHELRNPISPITNAVEILKLGDDNPATLEQVRELLERQVNQLAGIVDDLIDVSRIVERRIDLRIERVPIERVVRTAIESSRSLIEAREHQLSVQIPLEPVYLDVDPVRVSQVLVNLLNNAAKFTAAGGRIWLDVGVRSANGDRPLVEIRVRDTGIGIAEEFRERIFEMFEQGPAAHEHGATGMGIGLTLARSLVQMHDGTIEVHSEGPGHGSEFTLRLPAVDPASARPQPHPELDFGAGPSAARTILIVDDNRDQAESLGKLLQLLGHEVRLGYDGEEALKLAQEFHPEVVLLDLGLPKLSGYEVAQRMQEDPRLRKATLIAQTGWGQEQDRERTRRAGFSHHLVKPVDIVQLKQILSNAGK